MSRTADLLVRNAALVATCDTAGRELPGGWVAIADGLVSGIGTAAEPPPEAARTIDAAGCLITRLGAAGVGVAHCPSSNMILGNGRICPVRDLRTAGSPVGLGCDGSSSNDMASLWLEARTALLLGKMRGGAAAATARDALDLATRGGAACLGRTGEIGELTLGACGDLVVWSADPSAHAGACSDPVEAWLRCGPGRARDTVVAGRVLVDDGAPRLMGIDDVLARHRAAATRLQNAPVG